MGDKDLFGGRPLEPKGAELLGGYPLSEEARMVKKRPIARKRKKIGLEEFLEINPVIKENIELMANHFGLDKKRYPLVEKIINRFCDAYDRPDLVDPLKQMYREISGVRV